MERQIKRFKQATRTLNRVVGPRRVGTRLVRTRNLRTGIRLHNASVSQAAVKRANLKELRKNAHFVDLATAAYALDTTGSITLIATMAQGVSDSQRVGKKAAYKSVQVHGIVATGTTSITNDVAMLLVYDRDPTGSLPAITDILGSANPRAFNNDTNSDRFRIVRRWDYVLIGNAATPATGKEAKDFEEFVDLKNLPVQFSNAATGAIGDIKKGALYFVTVGANVAGTTAGSVTCAFRTRFIDVMG